MEPYPILGVQEINGTTHYSVRSEYHPHEGFIHRRYNDFLWLNTSLKTLFPHKDPPPFPSKTFGRAQTEEIVQRVFAFEALLDFIEKDPQLKNAPFYKDFYCVKDLSKHIVVPDNSIVPNIHDAGNAIVNSSSKYSKNIKVDTSSGDEDDDL